MRVSLSGGGVVRSADDVSSLRSGMPPESCHRDTCTSSYETHRERYAQVMVKSMWSDTATHDQGNDHREKPGDQSQLHPVHSTRQMSNLVPESTDLTAKLVPQRFRSQCGTPPWSPARARSCAHDAATAGRRQWSPIGPSPSNSSSPNARLTFWIACTAAPLSRLSSAATTTAFCPSALVSNPPTMTPA